jgi:hypothetical protein
MADVAEPGACQACGRPLPPQQGRGRKRRYCDARCRDAARRLRARPARRGSLTVKKKLTADDRHGYLDGMDGMSSADDPVALRVADTARRLIGEFTGGTSPADAVAAARDLSAAAEAAVQAAVDRARAAGQSWRDIGDVLGTSRQAAFQRFGHPVDPRTGEPTTRAVPPGAVQRATELPGLWRGEPGPGRRRHRGRRPAGIRGRRGDAVRPLRPRRQGGRPSPPSGIPVTGNEPPCPSSQARRPAPRPPPRRPPAADTRHHLPQETA